MSLLRAVRSDPSLFHAMRVEPLRWETLLLAEAPTGYSEGFTSLHDDSPIPALLIASRRSCLLRIELRFALRNFGTTRGYLVFKRIELGYDGDVGHELLAVAVYLFDSQSLVRGTKV